MHPEKSKTKQHKSASASGVPSREDPRCTAVTGEPVPDAELAALFAPLENFPVLILAVSGGADSLAMMHLVARWAQLASNKSHTVVVATVDHGLRSESASEAAWVGAQARAVGLSHETLDWAGEKPATGVQDAARTARYQLLAELALRCHDRGPVAIVTGHTQDDQAETFLMRLARGSGLDGLTGMSASRLLGRDDGVQLVRPLLGVARDRLVATLEARGLTWIDDPSNEADHFERVRVRKARTQLEAIGLSNEKIALSASRLERARDALEWASRGLEKTAGLDLHDGAYASLNAGQVFAAPAELRLRLFGRLIAAFGGQEVPPRLSKLEAFVEWLNQPDYEATLGGCIVSRYKDQISVFREPGRVGLPELSLAPGTSAIWDRRFRVSVPSTAGQTVAVRGLGAEAYSRLRKGLDGNHLPARAAATLPSFWKGGEMVGVPQLPGLFGPRKGTGQAPDRLCSAEFLW